MKINPTKILPDQSTFELEVRLTHKYNDGWKHLDQFDHIGFATPIAATKQKGNDEYWCNTMVVKVEAGEGAIQSQIMEALEETFAGSRCQHEHDCCGCVSTSVYGVRPMRDGHYALRMSYSRNI